MCDMVSSSSKYTQECTLRMLLFVLESEQREIRKDVSSRIKVQQAVVQFQSRLQIIMGI